MIFLDAISSTITDIIDKASQADPTNAIGYGLALTILIIVTSVFYKNWKSEVKYSRLRDEKVIEFNSTVIQWMKKVEIRLEDQQGFTSSLSDIKALSAQTLHATEEIRRLILKHLK